MTTKLSTLGDYNMSILCITMNISLRWEMLKIGEVMYTEFLEHLASFMNQEDIKLNEPMKKHTSFRVGGPAKVFLTVHSEEILTKILVAVNEKKLPYFVLGNGSNLLVSDLGYEGVMIYLGEEFSNIEIKENYITLILKK